MLKCLFEGCGVAVVTPFRKGVVDFEGFNRVLLNTLNKGAKAIIVLGTTGEGVSVSKEERSDIIRFCKKIIGNRAKLIVGTGNNNFITCQENTFMAKKLGADGVLVVTPYYNKTTQNGIVEYYEQLSKIGIPIIMYNVPSRTGLNIEIETVKKLLDNKMIYGLKESTCDINRIIELSKVCKDKIALYSGEDNLNFLFYCLGAKGCISVTANVMADKVQQVFDLVKNEEIERGLKIQNELDEINHAMFLETNPIPVKNFMSHLGVIEEDVRLPLVKATEKTDSLLLKLANRLKSDKEYSV